MPDHQTHQNSLLRTVNDRAHGQFVVIIIIIIIIIYLLRNTMYDTVKLAVYATRLVSLS